MTKIEVLTSTNEFARENVSLLNTVFDTSYKGFLNGY